MQPNLPDSTLATIPPRIPEAFQGRAELSLRDLANAMGTDIRTLQKQREAGQLPVHIAGLERVDL